MNLSTVVGPEQCLAAYLEVGGIFGKGRGLLWVCFFHSCKGEVAILFYEQGERKDANAFCTLFLCT